MQYKDFEIQELVSTAKKCFIHMKKERAFDKLKEKEKYQNATRKEQVEVLESIDNKINNY